MRTIQLELQDDLAKKLVPYHNKLSESLKLGIRAWQEREQRECLILQERLTQVLTASGKAQMPRPYTGERPYARHTPVPVTGKPISELVIEQRGPR